MIAYTFYYPAAWNAIGTTGTLTSLLSNQRYYAKPYPRVCREKLEGSLALMSSWKYQTSLQNILIYFFRLRKKGIAVIFKPLF